MSEHRLDEIVIERPRGGMRISLRKQTGFKKQLRKLTEEATEDGLLRPYLIKPRNKSKYLSDHLGPLRRFLRSQVGQPWNNVYSQLCQRLDSNTMAGLHVLSHVWQYVERDVELIDDIPYSKPNWRFRSRLDAHYRDQFYVHPETGLLCAAEKIPRKRKQTPSENNVVVLDGDRQYHKLDEIWYLVVFQEFPPPPTESVRDALNGLVFRPNARYLRGRKVYAASKQQCSKKEIRFILSQLPKQ